MAELTRFGEFGSNRVPGPRAVKREPREVNPGAFDCSADRPVVYDRIQLFT